MVNNKILASQEQRWLLMAVIAAVSLLSASAMAQDPYYSNSYRIYPGQTAAPAPTSSPPRVSNLPQGFQVQANNQKAAPAPPRTAAANITRQPSAALANAFATRQPLRNAQPSGRFQGTIRQNPTDDIFGENKVQTPVNPFQKVQGQDEAPAQNPFGEITPETPQRPQSPFNELPQNPNPITPPMDTNPISPPQQIAPVLPPGSEFTPNPGMINTNPPVPGQPDQPRLDPRPRDDEGAEPERPLLTEPEDPELPDPGQIDEDDTEKSIFDRVQGDEEQADNKDIPPVPAPRSSRVYLPARDPLDYVESSEEQERKRTDPRNPYANLPGPYGYPAQPPYPGYPPYPNPYAGAVPPAAYPGYPGYGQCSPGCMPISAVNNFNSCNSGCNSGCNSCCNSGCNSCNSCSGGSRPALLGSDIGERIVETADVACGAETAYVDVVSACDDACTNFASCYVSVFGGWSDLNDFVTQSDVGTGIYFEDSGYVFGAAIGQIQGRNLRTELELSYRNIDVNGLQLNGSVPSQFSAVNGDLGTFAGMVNAYWEFVDFRAEKIKPYFGAGVGFAIASPNLRQPSGEEAVITDDESSFAWQLMAGFNYKASPTLDAFVEYRYFVADSFRLDTQIPEISGLGNGSGPFDYQSSNVLFGLRARF